MHRQTRQKTTGFTLVELLVVIAIIGLLIGILVPAVSGVKDQGKKVSTRSLLETLGKGCEAFHGDFERYPRSSSGNPFEATTYEAGPGGTGSEAIPLSGAQWLILELAGADLKGYVMVDPNHNYDANNDGILNQEDWWLYYDPTVSGNESLHRFGPYVPLDGKVVQTPEQFGGTLPPLLDPNDSNAGVSDWNNGRLPFAIDAFGYPVLYYRANEHALKPFTDHDAGRPMVGRYDQWDNDAFTGSVTGSLGFDLGGGIVDSETGQHHWLYELGWSVTRPSFRPEENTFADAVFDAQLFEQQGQGGEQGRVWPHRPDTFLLISPGKDAVYGTSDDVMNF
ncbi:MAG: prepilin-type N-terminal cleavage/methylation domain-containing protein [Phycisphaerae bacterium]|nr:prepilin-type N-terminal cleavage/methylation domain-containing protein [Phycisphaerae bacterium]